MTDLSNVVWRKSTHTTTGSCVEVAFIDGGVAVRDSKDESKEMHRPVLIFTAREWHAFIAGVRDGEFDLP